MFFKDFAVEITDVFSIKYNKTFYKTDARSFYALSYRKDSDTYFGFKNHYIEAKGKCIAYVPANLDYIRSTEGESMIVIHFIIHGSASNDIEVFYPSNPQKYSIYFDEILREWNSKECGFKFKCNEYLNRLIYLINTENSHEFKLSLSERVADIIEKNLSNSRFSVAEIAPMLRTSGTYMRRIFKKDFGSSPKEYLTKKRVEQAISLIQTQYFTIKEISQRCGFENEKYFSTVFKKQMGVSPTFYINR